MVFWFVTVFSSQPHFPALLFFKFLWLGIGAAVGCCWLVWGVVVLGACVGVGLRLCKSRQNKTSEDDLSFFKKYATNQQPKSWVLFVLFVCGKELSSQKGWIKFLGL